MKLSVKIDTEEKKRRKSIRTKNLFAHHGSFSRLCLKYNLNINIQTDKQTNKQTNKRIKPRTLPRYFTRCSWSYIKLLFIISSLC